MHDFLNLARLKTAEAFTIIGMNASGNLHEIIGKTEAKMDGKDYHQIPAAQLEHHQADAELSQATPPPPGTPDIGTQMDSMAACQSASAKA